MGRFLRACRDLRDGSPHRQALAMALFGVALCAVPLFANDYWVRLLVFIFVNIALASSWNVIGGVTGYPSFGHSVFFGLGAYTAAIVMVRYELPMAVGMVAGGIVAAAFSLLFLPVFRQKGLYFALSTLAALLAVETLVHKWEFTRGFKSWVLGWTVPSPLSLDASYVLFVGLLCGTVISVIYLLRSKTGLALHALHKDEVLASSIGIPTTRYKAIAFAASAVWPGVIGAAFAPFMTYISTESMFDVTITLNMILISIFGGIGTILGPILGGIVLSVIDQIAWGNFLEYHRLIYGLLIVLIITYRPGGIVSWLWDLEQRLNRKAETPTPRGPVAVKGSSRHATIALRTEGRPGHAR